jgi:hypothetical protein
MCILFYRNEYVRALRERGSSCWRVVVRTDNGRNSKEATVAKAEDKDDEEKKQPL